MSVMNMEYRVTMPDGSIWGIPVRVIADDRAKAYADNFGGANRSLKEDTLPLFESDEYEIEDWAKNNMNWDDVKDFARRVQDPDSPDYQDGWVNGEVTIVGKEGSNG